MIEGKLIILEQVQEVLGSLLDVRLTDHSVQLILIQICLIIIRLSKLSLDVLEVILLLALLHLQFKHLLP